MLLNGNFAAPAADAARTDKFGIFVNCADRRFGHDRVFSRIKILVKQIYISCQIYISPTTSASLAPVRQVFTVLRYSGFSCGRPDATWTDKLRAHVLGASGSYGVDRKRDLIRDFLQNTSISGRKLILSRAKDAHNPDAIAADDQGNRADGPISLINGESIGGKANFLPQIATNYVGLVFEYPSGLTGFTIQELPWAKNAIFMAAGERTIFIPS